MKIHCPHDRIVPISELKSHPKNRNSHPDDQITRLAQILEYQGFRYPIKVSKLSGFVTSGHGRIEAAKKLGWTEVPVSFQAYDDEAMEYADVIADNSIASWSELDLSAINTDIQDLGPEFDVDLLGLKDFTIEVAEKYGDPDEVPEAPKEPVSKLGDLYELGSHRLLCGDSTSIDAVERLMNGEKADMVFTDPPYQFEPCGRGFMEVRKPKHLKDIESLGICNFDPSILLMHAETNVFFCNKALIPNYLDLANKWQVSWDLAVYKKENPMPLHASHLLSDLEYIFVLGKQMLNGDSLERDEYSKLFVGKKDSDNKVSWSKPIALCEKFIKIYSKESVLDYYGGSGSTLIACEKTKRKCFMMEIDPHYIDVIVSRWCKFTGQTKIKRNGEEIEWQWGDQS